MLLKTSVLALLCAANAVSISPKAVHLRQMGSKTNMTQEANKTTAGLGEGGVPIFQLLVREWKKVPELGPFSERCEALISKLLPRLRYEYTALNVPKVLLHDCDVYTTKEDYKTNNTGWDTARYNCRYSARRLGEEFDGKKDYKGWCQDLHAYLMDQQNLHIQKAEREKLFSEQDALRKQLADLKQQYEDMLKAKGKITAELDAMGKELHMNYSLPCCPESCRICTPAEMAAEKSGNKTKLMFF
jgi:hypothetical protein